MRISEGRELAGAARSKQLVCPRCSTHIEIKFPYYATEEEKMDLRRTIIDEHVRVCVAGPADEIVVYPISYPRQ